MTLGHTPVHSFSQYLQIADIQEATGVSEGKVAVASILDAFKVLITLQRELLSLSDSADDEGTNALMSDYIREQEKLVWMYSAYLG